MGRFASIAFTPRVKTEQERMGSRRAYARAEGADRLDELGDSEKEFLLARDSFYMATVGETGWPYIQHRGGPRGFVKVLDPHTIGFGDYRGNKQYVSLGNVGGDDRVALIFVDYPNRARLKVLARARVVTQESDPETFAHVAGDARVERVYVLRVEGLDWNCPQHITPRFTEEEVCEITRPLVEKLEALERENAALTVSRP
jgi:predicted pyridoxine 5'-phosphate oxidase superfamily flavin-nucleotide-binding protein